MTTKRDQISARDLTLPDGARQALASFGVTDEDAQNDVFTELAIQLTRVADDERAMGLRSDEA